MRQKFDKNFSTQIFLKVEFDIFQRTRKIVREIKMSLYNFS